MDRDRYEDEVIEGLEVVRAFMATNGRTRPDGVPELPPETLVAVEPSGSALPADLEFERERIVAHLSEEMASVAEVAAHLKLPLRAAVTIVSELVADGHLRAEEVVELVDLELLQKIRTAISAL